MPEPTDVQVDKVREITGENSYTFVAALIDKLTDGQWARALQLITAWDTEYPAGESIGVSGGSRGIQYNPHVDAGGDIRSRMRLLLGLPELRSSDLGGQSFVLRNEFVF